MALAAFDEFRHENNDSPALSRNIGNIASLAESGELIVATTRGNVVGAVTYVGWGKPKKEFFPVEWPVVRMHVVAHRIVGEELHVRLRRNASVVRSGTGPP